MRGKRVEGKGVRDLFLGEYLPDIVAAWKL